MNSKYFICSCLDLTHILEVNTDSIHEGGVYFTMILNDQHTLWRRFKVAYYYVIGKKGSASAWGFDSVVLTEKQKQELIQFLGENK